MTRDQWQAMVDHAVDEAPKECCGYVRAAGGRVDQVVRARNEYESPRYGYMFGFETLRAVNDLDDEGAEVGVYHSHPRSAAEPSQTDINLAQYPHWTYLIVSLADRERPEVRAWKIRDGRVEEEPVEVE